MNKSGTRLFHRVAFYKLSLYKKKLLLCSTGKSESIKSPYLKYYLSGFTLIELMVTVAILAIIAIIATPALLTQLADMEARRVKNQLTTTLATAKSESYIRRQNILVCLSNAGGRCHRDSDKKLLLFIDNNHNNHFDTQTDLLLSQQSLDPRYSTLHLRVGASRHYIKFWGDSGKPRGYFGHIKYCPTSNYNQRMYQISFNQNGIIKYKPNSIHATDC